VEQTNQSAAAATESSIPTTNEPSEPTRLSKEFFEARIRPAKPRQPQDDADVQREAARAAEAKWRPLGDKLGRRYANARFVTFDATTEKQQKILAKAKAYAENMKDEVADGRNVVLFGPPGTGKDHLMVAMLRVAVQLSGLSVMWVNGLDLYGEIRDAGGLLLEARRPGDLGSSSPQG
jgi:DNA replication protein DnaC